MTKIGQFDLLKTDGSARAGVLHTAHGAIATPVFMPVGTKASVKSLDPEVVAATGAQIVLGNTYHLYLAPGHELVQKMGGLHKFMQWDKPILTDSGGFQVFSLGFGKNEERAEEQEIIPEAKVTEDGVEFRSHKDGSKHQFNAENVMEIQAALGADIIMAFDECPPYPATDEYYYQSMQRTHRWLERCITHKNKLGNADQLLFGIVQGGMVQDYRRQSAEFVTAKNLPGIAIGGIANGGEGRESMLTQVDWVVPYLPADKPHYLMGVGTPLDLVDFVARGIDMFDCVLPTRLARNGGVWIVEDGKGARVQLKNARFADDPKPLMDGCDCSTCTRFSRAYLHHLFMEHEPLAMELASVHNISILIDEMALMREAILAGEFDKVAGEIRKIWS